jgi:hypothetical protein
MKTMKMCGLGASAERYMNLQSQSFGSNVIVAMPGLMYGRGAFGFRRKKQLNLQNLYAGAVFLLTFQMNMRLQWWK